MANPTEPATTEPTGALFRALRSVDVDPELAYYRADEESHRQAGENVIAAIGAQIESQTARIGIQITELTARIDAQGSRIDGRFSQIEAQITEVKAELKAQGARIDDLQKVVWRVIWPLIVLLAVPVFGLLYKVLTTGLFRSGPLGRGNPSPFTFLLQYRFATPKPLKACLGLKGCKTALLCKPFRW